jgi:hypothetical protein
MIKNNENSFSQKEDFTTFQTNRKGIETQFVVTERSMALEFGIQNTNHLCLNDVCTTFSLKSYRIIYSL